MQIPFSKLSFIEDLLYPSHHGNTLYVLFRLAFPGNSVVKYPPAKQDTQVHSLGREDPLEEDVATHSSILTWRIPTDRGAWWATVHRVTKSQT